MGKKGSWFSAIKRIFTHNSKEKSTNVNGSESEKKSSKEKKKGKGILQSKSLIPLFREPSSIEKILGEADQLLTTRPTTTTTSSSSSSQQPKTSPGLNASPPHLKPLTASSNKASESIKEIKNVQRPEPTLTNQHLSATKIQNVFRGYLARRSFRTLRGLVRLQQVVRGHSVKRQTMNAMKQMQMLVRVQTQIQSRRIQILENQQQQQAQSSSYKEVESTLSKWTNQLGQNEEEDWDDSLLTKEEEEARLRKKVEAVIKRERAMAYAYSHPHHLWKANPKSADQSPLDIRSNGFPWWWNWLERHDLPEAAAATSHSHTQSVTKSIAFTPPRPNSSEFKLTPPLHNKQTNFTFHNHDSLTPRSSRSVRPHQLQTPPPNTSSIHNIIKYSKPRATSANSSAFDDDSLMSCPPFSVPNYMTPTVSAKAKARANSNPKDRFPRTPGNESNRRFSFPLTPNIAASLKAKGGRSNKDSASQTRSIGEFSAVSMPALVGRKPFNRFV